MSSSSSRNPSTSSLTSVNECSLLIPSSSDTSWEVQAEDFTKELTCVLCIDLFTEPVILDCGHNFCRLCIEDIWVKKGAFFCPQCQITFPNKKFVINTVLENMVQKIKHFNVCSGQQKCLEHNETMTLYWKPHGKLACFSCRDAQKPKDQSTQFLLIPDAVQIYTVTSHKCQIKILSAME